MPDVVSRRERERAAVRDRLVAVALETLEREGAAALTVRRIAGAVEYTAPVVYQHFANKDALLVELARVGHERLHERLLAAGGDTADGRVLAAARAYLAFARDNPHLYRLMNDPAVDADERYRASTRVGGLLIELVTGWAAENGVAFADPIEHCQVVWGTLFGIAGLGMLGTIGFERANLLADNALHALMAGWSTQ